MPKVETVDGINVKCGVYPEFEIDGVTYHLNFRYEPFHVTSTNPYETHYYFKKDKNDEICNAPVPSQDDRKKKFSKLPINVQNYIKKNYYNLVRCIEDSK